MSALVALVFGMGDVEWLQLRSARAGWVEGDGRRSAANDNWNQPALGRDQTDWTLRKPVGPLGRQPQTPTPRTASGRGSNPDACTYL